MKLKSVISCLLSYALLLSDCSEGKSRKHHKAHIRHSSEDYIVRGEHHAQHTRSTDDQDPIIYNPRPLDQEDDRPRDGRLFGFFEENGSGVGDYIKSGASSLYDAAGTVRSYVKVVTDPIKSAAGTVLSPIHSAVQVVTNPIKDAIGTVTAPVTDYIKDRVIEYATDHIAAQMLKIDI